MRSSLQSLWRANLLFYLGLFLHCGEARVNTEAPTGPLYRVVGSPLSLSCNVSGFTSASSQKEFEYRVQRPGNTRMENIGSTRDPDFGYSSYKMRMGEKEITLTHVSPNSVSFEITSLKKSDQGEYECSVVNPDYIYDGTYTAVTSVKVIDNSLSVSSPASTSLSYNEGDAYTSTCQASSNTVQHTHLSLSWFLQKDGEETAQPIISLDRYFTLSPGPGFEWRYQAGLISLEKVGEATYKLKMAQLQLSDRGRVFCRAQEWIQDPDRSWYSITQKDTEKTTLQVIAREVVPDTSSLAVRVSVQSTSLQVGQKLSISCNVNTQNAEGEFFSVAWFRGGVELARIGPTGVLSVGHEYRVREEELRVGRISDKDFDLRLQPVIIEDQGEYLCRAWPQKRGQDGAFTQGVAQDSSPQRISISATESGLLLEMQNDTRVNENDALKLMCKVHGYTGQLSVTWLRKSADTSSALFTTVISLSQEGVVAKAEEFESWKIIATRPATDTFTLELDGVTPSDSGVYQCAVSEWEKNRKTNSRSQTTRVTVTELSVNVNLISRESRVTVGNNVELICRVRAVQVPITVTWTLQRDASTIDNILTVYADGTISWSGDQHRYQLKVQKTKNEFIHYLLINGASHREKGRYQCGVTYNINKKSSSNWLAVQVQDPESKLVLTSAPPIKAHIDDDVELKCSVISEPSESSRYAVTWQLEQEAVSKVIVSSDQDAKVTFGPEIELSQRQRISVKRTKGPSFELSIRQAWISDSGSYSCEVVEWLQDPGGDWSSLLPVSKTTNLTVVDSERKLSISRKDGELNVSRSENFTVPCHITEQSSNKSEFQVTWFWGNKTENKQRAVFTAYRNATLHDWLKKGDQLRFGHPLPNQFSLTVLKPGPEDGGLYFCEVEEWIQSLSHGWRKVTKEQSGILTIYVHEDGNASAVSEPVCNARTWIWILVAFNICTLLVLLLLVLKICRSPVSEGKKSGKSLWTEQHPLNTTPSAKD
ncbi:immunoglobulin superfamily member 2-like [Notolabrus celidotus]|uniref:immunoglobulin superfamily member 2-like n=1 Tax=Notolabrus celidotus TaxID=1203425 RepID=UPI00148F875A|nr:immunoglobulin superfamily member 2-like [Notolabrus celidotus]